MESALRVRFFGDAIHFLQLNPLHNPHVIWLMKMVGPFLFKLLRSHLNARRKLVSPIVHAPLGSFTDSFLPGSSFQELEV
jgi:hypothetical protein